MAERVLVTREIPEAGLRPLEDFDVTVLSELPPERGELLEAAKGVAGVLSTLTENIDAEFMDAAGDGLKAVANLAVGYPGDPSQWVGAPDDSTPSPAYMDIDWIRAYAWR